MRLCLPIPNFSRSLALAMFGLSSFSLPSLAQYAPSCLLNGVKIYCSITSFAQSKGSWQRNSVVLADDRRIDLHVDRRTCREERGDKLCLARITMRDARGSGTAQGHYRVHRWEGGVSHSYAAEGVELTYFFMD